MAHAAKAWAVVLLVAAATALAACGGSGGGTGGETPASTTGRTGGTVVWAKSTEAPELDPAPSTNVSALQLMDQVYETLVGIDDHLRVTPKLAASWQQTSPTTWVFDIRRGVRFSNGRPMTVDDVVGSLRRLMDPKVAASWAARLGDVKRISAKGDAQVEIVLNRPNNTLLQALAFVNAAVLPMKELDAGTFDPRRQMLGTGPFAVASHTQDEAWNLVRNPYYWRKDEPKADRLTVRIMTDDAARVAALRDGSVDVVNFDTPDAVRLLKGVPNLKTVVVPSTEFYRLTVNSRTSLFRDPRLRQALALALDRRQISDVALGGMSEPTTAVTPNFGVCSLDQVPNGRQDLKRAAQLVEQAGAKGKTVSLIGSPTYKPLVQIAQVVAQQLKQIGLNVRIEQLDQGAWLARVYMGRSDFDVDVSFFGDYGDPVMGLQWWSSNQSWHPWIPADKQLDALIDKAGAETPGPERDSTIKAACARIHANASLIPLVTKPVIVAYRSDRVGARLPAVEGYFDPIRYLADFSVKAG